MVTTLKGARGRAKRKRLGAPEGGAAPRAAVAAGEVAQATAAERKRAEALLAIIDRRKDRLTEDFYDLGEALRELQRKRLYVALGHASFSEMLRARRIMGLSQAKKLIEVVASLPRDRALELGPEKAYALTRYAVATPEVDTPRARLDRGAALDDRSVEDRSVREIVHATNKAKALSVKPRPAQEREALQAARKLQVWLRKQGARDVVVVAYRDSGGWWLHVEVRVDVVGKLTEKLTEA